MTVPRVSTTTFRLPLCALAAAGLFHDPVRAGSEVLLENESVRVVYNSFVPGETSGDHEHAYPRFVFPLEEGILESVDAAGSALSRKFEAEQCLYSAPQRHTVRNIGLTSVSLLEVELKSGYGPSAGSQECRLPTVLSPGAARAPVAAANGAIPARPGTGPNDRGRAGSPEGDGTLSDGSPALAPPNPPASPRTTTEERLRSPRRTILLSGPDLLVSRVELPVGTRDKGSRDRGERVIYVLRGGPLTSAPPNGKRAVTTEGGALWVGAGAPLIAPDEGQTTVLLEIEPKNTGSR